MTNLIDELAAFGPAAGELGVPVNPYNDFWGVITGFSVTDAEQTKFKDGKKTDEKWILRVMRMEILMDDGRVHNEDFTLPYDKTTGVILTNADGSIKRPDRNSKWGRFESILVGSGLDYGHPNDLIGLHAHFLARSVWGEGRNPIEVKGRYIVEYDGYNNDHRKSLGLSKRETEKCVVTFPEPPVVTATTEADKAKKERTALALMPGRTRVEILTALTKNGLSPKFLQPDYLAKLLTDKVLRLDDDGKTYLKGENYPIED